MRSNGRVFTNGTIIKSGEQLPTQQVLHYCLPIVRKVRGPRPCPCPMPMPVVLIGPL